MKEQDLKRINKIKELKEKRDERSEKVKAFNQLVKQCDKYQIGDLEVYKEKVLSNKVDLWDMLKKQSKRYIESFGKKGFLNVVLNKKKYIALCFVADQHIGNVGTDYDMAETHAKLIGKTKNAYAILGGDGIDNFIKASILPALINQVTSPKEQVALLEKYIGFFNDHILAMTSGNHERWTKQVSGLDFLSKLAKTERLLYSPDKYKIRLFLNDIEYKIYVRHKYKYNSTLNLTHTVKRLLTQGDWDFDIGAVHHHHQYNMESFLYHNTERIAIRTGSYKVADAYSRQEGYNSALPLMPMVILSPHQKEMVMFKDLEQGLEFLKFKNKDK